MAQEPENMLNDDLGQKLNTILSDPESLSRLAGMASALASSGVLSGLMGSSGGDTDGSRTEENRAVTENPSVDRLPSENLPEIPSDHDRKSQSDDRSIRALGGRHAALLRALKPYLGQEKQARIDQMMRLLQLAELADTVLRGK